MTYFNKIATIGAGYIYPPYRPQPVGSQEYWCGIPDAAFRNAQRHFAVCNQFYADQLSEPHVSKDK